MKNREAIVKAYTKMYNAHNELSRRELKYFAQTTFPEHSIQWFHKMVLEYLFLWITGAIKKLAIFMPPQHGKSWMSSVVAPAFILGKNPKAKIVCASYAETIASKFNRLTQDLLNQKRYKEIFTETRMPSAGIGTDNELRNSKYFETVGHKGFYKAVGVGGSLTSETIEYGIIDDPIKDRKQANSATYRETLWDWYVDVWRTRLNNDSRELMLFTRWHEDDLAGRIFDPTNEKYDAELAEQFTVITLPALRESEPPSIKQSIEIADPREIGDALWEEKHSRTTHEADKKINPYGFASLKQQRPAPLEGGMIKREWLEVVKLGELPFNPELHPYHFMIDGAYTEKTSNDPTAIIVYQVYKGVCYVHRCISMHKELNEFLTFAKGFMPANGYDEKSNVRVEYKSSGPGMISMMKQEEHGGFNASRINSMHVSYGKYTRGEYATPSLASGKVKLVQGEWVSAFVKQCCTFPNDTHDDMFDLLCYMVLQELSKLKKTIYASGINKKKRKA